MFLPVACLKCGKLFQVPTAAAGTEVTCPWCQVTTPALPVAAVAAGPSPPAPTNPAVEPLSLDDAESLPSRPSMAVASMDHSGFPLRTLLIALFVVVVVTVGTIAVLGYGAGRVPGFAWGEFTSPDGSCSTLLPGAAVDEVVGPNPAAPLTRGGQRFVTTGWYSGVSTWVGWQDLDPEWAKQAANDRDGALIAPLLAAERDRRRDQVGGTVVREVTVRYAASLGVEVEMTTPRGQLVERLILAASGPRPRLYCVGIEGRKLAIEGPAARGPAAAKLLTSFRINPE